MCSEPRGRARNCNDFRPPCESHGVATWPNDGRDRESGSMAYRMDMCRSAALAAGMCGQRLRRPSVIGSQDSCAKVMVRPGKAGREHAAEHALQSERVQRGHSKGHADRRPAWPQRAHGLRVGRRGARRQRITVYPPKIPLTCSTKSNSSDELPRRRPGCRSMLRRYESR